MMGRATKIKCPNVIEHLSATAPSQVFGKLSDRAAAAQQIDDHHNQGNDEQYVNQTTGHVQAKTQDPQNQKHSNNRPKHVSLLSSFFCVQPYCVQPCGASFRPAGTPLSGFPHSRHNLLARGVINPQNGHILCDRTSCGFNVATNFSIESGKVASHLRTRLRSGG